VAAITPLRRRRFPSYKPVDADYWLCRCEGFRVDSNRGRLGVVEEVRFSSRHDRPDWLAIRSGFFARNLSVVAVDDVAAIYPREGLILLTA
jgi:hypothetical protein